MHSHRMVTAAALVAALVCVGPALAGCSSDSDSAAVPGKGQAPGRESPSTPDEGHTYATYEAATAPSTPLGDGDLRRAAEVLRARAKAFGLTGTTVEVHGTTISVQAPGDSADTLRRMAATTELVFRPVVADATLPADLQQRYAALDCGSAGAPLASRPDKPTAACDRKLNQKYPLGPAALDGTDVKSATYEFDRDGGSGWIVNLDFTATGATKFARVTGALAQQVPPANQFAILVDGDILSAPSVQQAITGGKAQISGTFTQDSARNLAALISTGALPMTLTVSSITRQS